MSTFSTYPKKRVFKDDCWVPADKFELVNWLHNRYPKEGKAHWWKMRKAQLYAIYWSCRNLAQGR